MANIDGLQKLEVKTTRRNFWGTSYMMQRLNTSVCGIVSAFVHAAATINGLKVKI